MARRFALGHSRNFLPLLLCLSDCSGQSTGKISLDTAVATANQAVAEVLSDGKFKPQRVEIAEESENHATNRCLTEDWDDTRISERARRIREKLVGKKYYVIRYPLPAPYRDSKGGWLEWVGWEHCVFVDSGTGEVLGVVAN